MREPGKDETNGDERNTTCSHLDEQLLRRERKALVSDSMNRDQGHDKIHGRDNPSSNFEEENGLSHVFGTVVSNLGAGADR